MTIEKEEQKICDDYEGAFDDNQMRIGTGEEIHRRKDGNEYYAGSFSKDAYNGLGYYKNDRIYGPKWAYEGSFFSNIKEGYGQLSLSDNAYFEGLYQNDRPFGPGVLTRMNGHQDVGFWMSSSLIRLIREIPSEINELSNTAEHVAYITRFKKLVEISPPKSPALKVTKALNMAAEEAPQLYSIYVKNPKSSLFNYDETEELYFGDLKKMGDLLPVLSMDDFSQSSLENAEEKTLLEEIMNIEMVEPVGETTFNELTETGEMIGRTYTVDETPSQWERLRKRTNLLLAWNNSPAIVDIMTHTFVNRIYEKMAGFNVTHFLCNRRQMFESPGPLEYACAQLLRSSNYGDVRDFTWYLFSNHLNINVQDSKGNGCVMRAAASDHHALLYLMFLFGADLNTVNDEGFTALSHTLTRYLALINNVSSWGNCFLPHIPTTKNVKARIWRKCSETTVETRKSSSKSTRSRMTKKSSRLQSRKSTKTTATGLTNKPLTGVVPEEPPIYIFDLAPAKKATYVRRLSPEKKLIKKLSVFEVKKSADETEKQNRITEVCKTWALLLSLKINPNVSKVPQPTIVLAIFTGDVELVKMLLVAGADPNARMLPEEGWLTPLHILCLAKPQRSFPEIMDLLLEYGADPNARAAIDFSQENRDFVLHGQREEEFARVGVTPLQALLLRSDSTIVEGKQILKDLLLRLHDITKKERNYVGHSFLSLAVIRMNLAFVFTLLHIFSEDPNESLDIHWGNIATAYLTYLGNLKDPEAMITLIELEQAGMNPLRLVDVLKDTAHEENAINVGLRMLKSPSSSNNKKSDMGQANKPMKQSTGSYHMEKKKSRTTMSHISEDSRKSGGSQGRGKGKVHKELLKKVTLYQDSGRDKVDKYVRGVVIRRLLKYLRERENGNQAVDETDDPVKQAVNWFPKEDEFVQVLIHNVLAGQTFVGKKDVEIVYNMMPWGNRKLTNPHWVLPQKKLTAQRDSLGQHDKVLLRQLKEAIRIQLQSGLSPENVIITKKTPLPNSKKSKTKRSSFQGKNKDGGSFQVHDEHFDGSATTVDKLGHDHNFAAFSEKFDTVIAMCAPQMRWAKRYGLKSLRLQKRQAYRTDFCPEVDKNPFLYTVCYKCVKRDQALQLCPVCRLVWYCSSRCNTRDIMNPNSNHHCKADFYGRGPLWRQYDFDEDGNIFRVARKGQHEWEAEDMLNDSLVRKHGKRSGSPGLHSWASGRHSMRGTKDGQGYGHGQGKHGSSRHSTRDSKWRHSGSKGHGKEPVIGDSPDKSLGPKGYGRGRRKNSKFHFGSDGKHRAGSNGKYQVGRDGKHLVGPDGKYLVGPDGKRRVGLDGKRIKGGVSAAKGDKKARLREKMELKMKEARALRDLRNKLPQGVMGDFMRWGLTTMRDLQAKPWYQKRTPEGAFGSLDASPRGTDNSEAYNRLKTQLHMLGEMARVLGSNVDLHNLFPWVVFRDGELYYKVNPTLFVLENYSLN